MTGARDGAPDAGSLRLSWNVDRLDGMLCGLASLKPIARTGVESLDGLLGGGLTAGVHVVSALPACGKSTLCTQIADYVARFSKRKVIYVSCEMSAPSLLIKSLIRLSCELSEKPLTQGEVLSLMKASSAGGDRADLLTRVIDVYRAEIAPSIATCCELSDVSALEAVIDSESRGGDFAPIVFIDYLQLMRPQVSEGATSYEVVTEVMRSLCGIAQRHSTAVVAIASQNRGTKRGGASLDVLAGSSEIEYGATTVTFLEADGDGEAGPRRVRATVSKNRYGTTGSVSLDFIPAEARFKEAGAVVLDYTRAAVPRRRAS